MTEPMFYASERGARLIFQAEAPRFFVFQPFPCCQKCRNTGNFLS